MRPRKRPGPSVGALEPAGTLQQPEILAPEPQFRNILVAHDPTDPPEVTLVLGAAAAFLGVRCDGEEYESALWTRVPSKQRLADELGLHVEAVRRALGYLLVHRGIDIMAGQDLRPEMARRWGNYRGRIRLDGRVRCLGLRAGPLLLAGLVAGQLDKQGRCLLSVGFLSERLGMPRRTVERAIATARAAGAIHTWSRPIPGRGHCRQLLLAPGPGPSRTGGHNASRTGGHNGGESTAEASRSVGPREVAAGPSQSGGRDPREVAVLTSQSGGQLSDPSDSPSFLPSDAPSARAPEDEGRNEGIAALTEQQKALNNALLDLGIYDIQPLKRLALVAKLAEQGLAPEAIADMWAGLCERYPKQQERAAGILCQMLKGPNTFNDWHALRLHKRKGREASKVSSVPHIQNMPIGTPSCQCEGCVDYRAKKAPAPAAFDDRQRNRLIGAVLACDCAHLRRWAPGMTPAQIAATTGLPLEQVEQALAERTA